jgi:hypothetical protein
LEGPSFTGATINYTNPNTDVSTEIQGNTRLQPPDSLIQLPLSVSFPPHIETHRLWNVREADHLSIQMDRRKSGVIYPKFASLLDPLASLQQTRVT